MTNNKTQKELVLEHLKSGKTLSPMQALNLYQCFRLAAIIYKLVHDDGVKVSVDNTNNYAIYSLAI